jgi:hypothetical protein
VPVVLRGRSYPRKHEGAVSRASVPVPEHLEWYALEAVVACLPYSLASASRRSTSPPCRRAHSRDRSVPQVGASEYQRFKEADLGRIELGIQYPHSKDVMHLDMAY